jgi:2-keto-4-pentenoate hydratase/2-oxohepta-3-ene-1,7-dioic acid hydratase in catechol pathway
MKLVSAAKGEREFAGLWLESKVLDLGAAARAAGESGEFGSVLAILRGGDSALAALRRIEARAAELQAALLPAGEVQLLAPIPHPLRNVFCVGRNYAEHVKEGYGVFGRDAKLPTVPQFFTKATNTVNSPGGDVRLDASLTELLDYEVELALVIGRRGRDIPAEQALQHVWGYTVANDFSARDLQRRHDQWFKGKSLDTTCPIGPWIIDRDAIGEVATLELTLTVNGEERQRDRVASMIFDIPAIIASLSAGLTLEPGDIISTGTPSGVGFAMKPPQALKAGDLVVARIDRIGELRNRIVAA